MAQKKKKGYATRFGPRYGLTNRIRLANNESAKNTVCPNCTYPKVIRQFSGVWACKKCGIKFTSKAYAPVKPSQIKTEVEEI